MRRVQHFLPVVVLILFPLAIVGAFFWFMGSFGDPACDWELTAQTWEDINSNSIRDSDEPPLENVAISYKETRRWRADEILRVDASDAEGRVPIRREGTLGYCPDRIQVKAIAPSDFVPTTPDEATITDKSTTSIGFGFRREPGSIPPVHSSGTAQCSEETFQHTQSISGAIVRQDGDIWISSREGSVTLRRDGKDLSQEIEYFGSSAVDIASAPDGTIWVAGGMNSGIARFNGTSWKTYTTVYGALPSNDVNGVEVTGDGHVWALTSVGPADFNPVSGRWRNYSDIGNGTLLLSGPDNVLWLVGESNLIRFQSQSPRDSIRRIPVKLESVSSVEIWNAAVGAEGSIWLVGFADEWPMVVRYVPSTNQWTKYTYLSTRGSMPFDHYDSVGILSDGSVLVSGRRWGAIRLSPDDNPANAKWTTYPALVQHAQQGWLSVLTVLENGDVWLSHFRSDSVLMCKLSE